MIDFLERIQFRESWYLLLCLSSLLVLVAAWIPSGKVVFSSLSLLPQGGQSWRTRLLWLPPVLLALSAAGIAIAIAGPRLPDRTQRVEREGIAIMMVVDTSSSMQAIDLSTSEEELTRLDAVKRVFVDFVKGGGGLNGRVDDSIGIVSFAGFADTRCPLTLDHAILLEAAEELSLVTTQKEDGTAIGDGLGLAVERLRASEAKSKVIILLTDGMNTRGVETPLAAAELAATEGIKVYTIGAGTQGLAPVRVVNPYSGRSQIQQRAFSIDEETLELIAERTEGKYFRADDSEALRGVYQEIDKLERTKIGEDQFRRYTEYFVPTAGIALALAALAWLLQATALRRLP